MKTRITSICLLCFAITSRATTPPTLPKNLARTATATSMFEFDHERSAAGVLDGKIPEAGCRKDRKAAWAIRGNTVGGPTTLTLRWEAPIQVSELVVYGRTAHTLT